MLASLTDKGHLYYLEIQNLETAQDVSIQLTQIADIESVNRIHIVQNQEGNLVLYLLSDQSSLTKANISTR